MKSNEENNLEKKVDYLEFDDLENFESEKHYLSSLSNIGEYLKDDKSDWFNQFEALNDLRKLNKFFPRSFLEAFLDISKDFSKFLLSIRSNIAKLSLIVLKEFYGSSIYFTKNPEILKDYKIQNTTNIVISLFDAHLPHVLTQSSSMKGFLKEEAIQILDNIANVSNSVYFLKKIILQINNKNNLYSENAFNCAVNLLLNVFSSDGNGEFSPSASPEKNSNKIYNKIKEILECILNLYNLKKDLFTKKATKLYSALKDTITHDQLENSKSHLDNNSRTNLAKMENDHNKTSRTATNFNEFLNSRRK
jgi:hypothetical protein